MAAAGVIVTLVSIYSLFSIEPRVKQEFEKWAQQLESREIDSTNNRFKAFDIVSRAKQEDNLEQAEELTHEALSLYELLPNARRNMGLRFYDASFSAFIDKEHLNPLKTRYATARFDGYLSAGTDYSAEAKDWLLKGFKADEDKDGRLSYSLAVLYAMQGRLGKAREYLSNAASHQYEFTSMDYMEKAVFLYACKTENDINSLTSLLQWNAPIPKETLVTLIPALVSKYKGKCTLLCLRKDTAPSTVDDPANVFYMNVSHYPAVDKYRLLWNKALPDQTNSLASFPVGEPVILAEVVEHIDSRYWVICDTIDPYVGVSFGEIEPLSSP